jgi:hypothetical protein
MSSPNWNEASHFFYLGEELMPNASSTAPEIGR